MAKRTQSAIDSRFANYIQQSAGESSRRSFLSKLTRLVFGAAGVTIASRAMLEVRPAFAQLKAGDWQNCGLKGYLCGTGNCSSTGTTAGSAWTRCCQSPGPKCPGWYRCSYVDYCSNTVTNKGFTGCEGAIPAHTPSWCGTAGSNYVCTSVGCSATVYTTQANCSAGFDDTCAWLTCTNAAGAPCYCTADAMGGGYTCIGGGVGTLA